MPKINIISIYQKWIGKEPMTSGASSDKKECMSEIINGIENETKTGDWIDKNCDARIYYICKRSK